MLRYLLLGCLAACVAGPACVTAGVWFVAGEGWALIALGVLLLALAAVALLADVIPDPGPEAAR